MPGVIRNFCGAMPVVPTSDPNVRMTTPLYGTVVIELDGQAPIYGYLRFPPTPITKTGPLSAVVAPCTANGLLEGGGRIWVNLKEERVIGPLALPVQGEGGFDFSIPSIRDGISGTFTITYPAVLSLPEGDGVWLVGPVEAKGTVN